MMNDYEQQEQNTTSHISYKDYKKMLNKNSKKQSIMLFIGAFCFLLIVFLGMAKMMSPDVDITLGDDTPQYEEEYMPRGEVDDRLRDLQMEDDSMFGGNNSSEVEDGEKVVIPKKDKIEGVENKLPEEILGQQAVKDTVGETATQPAAQKTQTQAHTNAVIPTPDPVQTQAPAPAPVQPSLTARVVVGNYPTIEQAEVAKSILQEAGLGVSPFVRKAGTGYTLQVASYGSKEKAMSVAESLLNQNFPAKVVVEYK